MSDIIYPPPDIKNVIDKTAEFVAKVGDDFEKKVSNQQGGQAKFAFLNSSNPYRKYYDLRVRELREGKGMISPHFSYNIFRVIWAVCSASVARFKGEI